MTLTALISGNPQTITRLHSNKKHITTMDDTEQKSEVDNCSMNNSVTMEPAGALPQLQRFGEIDEPITPLDDHSYVLDLEQSSYNSTVLGGSAVFVDSYIDDGNRQKLKDLSVLGDNIADDNNDIESLNPPENDTPPRSTLTIEPQSGEATEKTNLYISTNGESLKPKNDTILAAGSLMDKLRVSEVFNAAKAKIVDEQNRPAFEFSRHISGEQLQNILKSVNTKELMESSDSESFKETLMHIQQAALDEVQEQEDQKGVVDEMLEAIATSSGVTELAGAISEQLRSQDVIEEAAERDPVDLESESTVLSDEDLRPESLKEPEEPIIHVDLSACTTRRSSQNSSNKEVLMDASGAPMEVLPFEIANPMLDYDEYWKDYSLQFIVMLSIALLALAINILSH